jgi:hypothetical protein
MLVDGGDLRRHKGRVGARPQLVNGPGEQFLARPRFSEQQDIRIGVRNYSGQLPQLGQQARRFSMNLLAQFDHHRRRMVSRRRQFA